MAVVGDIPASKLLADELELAQAVQQLSEHTPHTLAGAATHVAAVAADALSCEIGAVLLRIDGQTHVNGAGPAWDAIADDAADHRRRSTPSPTAPPADRSSSRTSPR